MNRVDKNPLKNLDAFTFAVGTKSVQNSILIDSFLPFEDSMGFFIPVRFYLWFVLIVCMFADTHMHGLSRYVLSDFWSAYRLVTIVCWLIVALSRRQCWVVVSVVPYSKGHHLAMVQNHCSNLIQSTLYDHLRWATVCALCVCLCLSYFFMYDKFLVRLCECSFFSRFIWDLATESLLSFCQSIWMFVLLFILYVIFYYVSRFLAAATTNSFFFLSLFYLIRI